MAFSLSKTYFYYKRQLVLKNPHYRCILTFEKSTLRTGVNISQKNWNYSVMGLRKFQNYSEHLKIILSNKVQNLCFGIIFVDFWGQFLVSKRNINLILVKFDINVDFLRKNSKKSLEFQKLFRKQSSRILRNIYPCPWNRQKILISTFMYYQFLTFNFNCT